MACAILRPLSAMKSWLLILISCLAVAARANAAPTLADPALRVETVVSGLAQPTTMAFIGGDDFFVLQKNDGKVFRVQNGAATEVLDLSVDNATEHGLLGIALHPQFGANGFVYLYYTETSAGGDSSNAAVANRVDKFHWDGSALTAAPGNPILSLPIGPTDSTHHNGGIIIFGPDEKLYVIDGDRDRNGQLQNFPNGPPDGTSVIHRLNDDGSVPDDNPFVALGDPMNKYFAYGIRNSFGMAFDPVTNKLWDTENGDTTYDEINLVEPGFNSGWESIMGPDSRSAHNAPQDLFVIPGSHYADPKFSWFDTVGPTAIVFLNSAALGAEYENDVFVGDIDNGRIYHFIPNEQRDGFVLSGGLADLVAEKDSDVAPLIFGAGFDGVTDLKVGPDGFLYVVSLFDGAVYRIVPGDPPLAIGALSLPDAEAGVPYQADLNISGGADPYVITPVGLLPLGIAPNGNSLSGIPNTAKRFKFALEVSDNHGARVRRQFSLNVLKPVAISTIKLKDARVGRSYKGALKAKGGKAPYIWSVSAGVLPSWASLDLSSGVITGAPAGAETQTFTVTVSDLLGGTDSQVLTLTSN